MQDYNWCMKHESASYKLYENTGPWGTKHQKSPKDTHKLNSIRFFTRLSPDSPVLWLEFSNNDVKPLTARFAQEYPNARLVFQLPRYSVGTIDFMEGQNENDTLSKLLILLNKIDPFSPKMKAVIKGFYGIDLDLAVANSVSQKTSISSSWTPTPMPDHQASPFFSSYQLMAEQVTGQDSFFQNAAPKDLEVSKKPKKEHNTTSPLDGEEELLIQKAIEASLKDLMNFVGPQSSTMEPASGNSNKRKQGSGSTSSITFTNESSESSKKVDKISIAYDQGDKASIKAIRLILAEDIKPDDFWGGLVEYVSLAELEKNSGENSTSQSLNNTFILKFNQGKDQEQKQAKQFLTALNTIEPFDQVMKQFLNEQFKIEIADNSFNFRKG